MPRRGAGLAGVVALVLVVAGCDAVGVEDPYRKSPESVTAESAQKLRGLPSSEDAEQRLTEAVVRMGDQVDELVPGLEWQWRHDRTWGNCSRPFDQTDGQRVTLPDRRTDGSIPDAVWPEALRRVRAIAAELGATEMVVLVERPGDHDVELYGDNAIDIDFGTKINTVIGARTGCHLPAKLLGSGG